MKLEKYSVTELDLNEIQETNGGGAIGRFCGWVAGGLVNFCEAIAETSSNLHYGDWVQ